jgi:hypothetical protein
MDVSSPDRLTLNFAQYRPGGAPGHYESWYLRANHPSRPLAFWIRYTIFSPAGRPADAVGQRCRNTKIATAEVTVRTSPAARPNDCTRPTAPSSRS